MSKNLNTDLLASMVRSKRGDLGLRSAASEIGEISAPTLLRVEQGKVPDVDTFISLCKWLEVSAETFIVDAEPSFTNQKVNTKDLMLSHLRADKTLDSATISILQNVIDLAFNKANHALQK
ncbi:MAG: XRE family transcriptional regulator [Bacteroidetes bacterium]|nr:MAG: XRE family transcriptional regulator [Bacteroidota bacterium]